MITKLTTDLNNVQALIDEPNDVGGMTAQQLKAVYDKAPNDIKTYINSLVDILNSTTDGSSGADNIGATAITDLDGATVQAILESIRNKLKSVTDGSSGADFINATSIDGLTGSTVQTLIKSLKTYSESYTYKKSETDSKLQGIVLGQIPSNSLTEDVMANDMKKDIIGGVTSYNTFNSHLADNTTYSTIKVLSSIDSNNIYTEIDLKRHDGTLIMKSVLSGGTSPSYTTRTETYYKADGTTISNTVIYTRTYDTNGNLASEVMN